MGIKRQLFLLLRIIWDFIHGMYAFHHIGPCVTVFGSARLSRESAEYQAACRVGMALGGNGLTVMTGGGPGLMEAASRGARQAGGKCIACRITLSQEQDSNKYIDRSVAFRYFFVRKVMLLRNSCALVVLPGGLGTLDELFEALTLIQTEKIAPLPIVFIGKEYWQPLLNVIRWMVSVGTISVKEMERVTSLMLVTDDIEEMIDHLKARRGHVVDISKPLASNPDPDLSHYSEKSTRPLRGKASVAN
ncbi:MAG TPA: TIGR00730 family Rossman fold protein [Candidatus Angelobacter sp.]|jgi:hypothetical protein|nr:TIGR00730 family Rossman fold protein [Candidatus Angelobacter sp.]